MTETTETTGTPWPSWLENLTPEQRVDVIVDAVKARYEPIGDGPYQIPAEAAKPFLLAVLEEARQGTEPADEWPATKLKAQLAVAVPALRRLALDDFMVDDRLGYAREHEARIAYAAGTLETIGRLDEPAADDRPGPVLKAAPDPRRDLMHSLVGRYVTVTSPSGSEWTGRLVAIADDPSILLEQADGFRPFLPQSFDVAEAPELAAGPEPEPVPPLPPGFFGRVELPGWRNYTGWFTSGGGDVRLVSDWDGNVLAEFVPGPNALIVHLPTPQKRPDPPKALTAPVPADPGDDPDDYVAHAPGCRRPPGYCDGECMEGPF